MRGGPLALHDSVSPRDRPPGDGRAAGPARAT